MTSRNIVTREIDMSDKLLALTTQQKDDCFGVQLGDRIIAVVKDGDRWRAVEQFGHRTDNEQFKAGIYLPGEIAASLKAGTSIIPPRLALQQS